LDKEMSKKKDRKGLGRGLSALMADIDRDTKITFKYSLKHIK